MNSNPENKTVLKILTKIPRSAFLILAVFGLQISKAEGDTNLIAASGFGAFVSEPIDLSVLAAQVQSTLDSSESGVIFLDNQLPYRLVNPKSYTFSGVIQGIPNQVAAKPSNQNAKSFVVIGVKSSPNLKGAVGVITYEVEGQPYRLAMCYSIPYDRILYKNYFKIQILNKSIPTDQALYEDMYYNEGIRTLGKIASAEGGFAEWINEYRMGGTMGVGSNCVVNLRVEPRTKPNSSQTGQKSLNNTEVKPVVNSPLAGEPIKLDESGRAMVKFRLVGTHKYLGADKDRYVTLGTASVYTIQNSALANQSAQNQTYWRISKRSGIMYMTYGGNVGSSETDLGGGQFYWKITKIGDSGTGLNYGDKVIISNKHWATSLLYDHNNGYASAADSVKHLPHQWLIEAP